MVPTRAGGPTDASASGASGTGGPAGGPSREADIFFPRGIGSGFDAQGIGRLVLDEAGCLRLRDEAGDSTVPLWLPDWELETGDGRPPRVLDGRGRPVGRVGRKVELGGGYVTVGMVKDGFVDDERTRRELLERCRGDYFLGSGHSGLE